MATEPVPASQTHNVKQVVPFLWVADMQASLKFYLEGLGYTMKNRWMDEGKLRWCWLELGGTALMLQEYRNPSDGGVGTADPDAAKQKRGLGVSLCFQCSDALALYREFRSRGLTPQRPFVGNAMWVTVISDPDGYKLDFESPTDAPEESIFQE